MSSDEHSTGHSRPRTATTRSALRHGEGSFRGLLSGLSRTAERSAIGPPPRERGTAYYLEEEMHAARQAVKQLDAAVSEAQSFREAATKLLTEAHKALGRLETAMDNREAAAELIGIACDIKCAAKRGITLVDVYGKYSTAVKIMTLFLRSYIHGKFDKQAELLKKLNPPLPPRPPPPPPPQSGVPLPPVAPREQQHLQQQQQQLAQQPSNAALCKYPSAEPHGISVHGVAAPSQPSSPAPSDPPPQGAPGAGNVIISKPLNRSSLGSTAGPPPPQAASGPLVGKALQSNRHEKVLAVAYVPGSAQVCIWWSAGQRLEFYAEATQATTGFTQAVAVTALAVDEAGGVWTGHLKGQVRVRPNAHVEAEVKEFTGAIRVIALDEAGRAWVGDEAGRIKVLAYGPGPRGGGQLETVACLQRSPALLAKMKGTQAAGGLFGKRHCGGGAAAVASSSQGPAAAVLATATGVASSVAAGTAAAVAQAAAMVGGGPVSGREGSPGGVVGVGSGGGGGDKAVSNHPHAGTMEGPVRCIFVRGSRVWASGGRSPCAWLQLWDTETFQDLDVFECGSFGPCHAIAALRWPASSTSASAAPGQHRHTQSDPSRGPHPPPHAGGGSFGSGGPSAYSWRLLTGHENGQLLLWHPEHRALAPLLRIGEPGSPCRGIAAFEAYNLVVTGHQGGYLHLFIQPGAETGLPPGSESASPQSLGTHRPKMATVTAHKSRLDRMNCGATSCVTVSILGTIRLWHAAELVQEAHRLGLTLAHTPSYGSLLGVDMSQPGTSHYLSNSSSQFAIQRESGKCLAVSELPQHASGQLIGSPPGAVGSGLAGGSSYHHGRQSSKDSVDMPASAQPSSGATTTGTGPLTADALSVGGPSLTGPTPSAGSSPHFQTIEFAELRTIKTIGSGAYGEVLLADWMGSEVAVKRLFAVQTMDDHEYTALMNEVTLLGSLSHPNVVRFLAMCVDPPCIVMQHYSHGSLFNMLRAAAKGKAAKEMTWSKRLEMLRDVAAGMQYLHSRKPPVIHGDLRSPNLLLDLVFERERTRFHVKIADFGLARMATGAGGSVMVSKMTNPRWLAPEVMKNSSVGKAADVYSFAIIMWEMLTWQQPFQDMMSIQVLYSMANGATRPDVPPDAELPGNPGPSLSAYRALMERCWQADAAARPSFKEIVEVFQDMLRVEVESSRQRRPHQPPPQGPGGVPRPPPQQLAAPRSGSSTSDAAGRVASPPAAGGDADAHAAEAAGVTVSAPGSGSSGSGGAVLPAVAAVAAAARRTAAAGVASPFMGSPLPGSEGLQEEHGPGAPADGGGHAHGHQQYGSVLPLYGMSPILEETASVTASQVSAGGGTSAGGAAAAPASAAADAAAVAAAPPHPYPHQHYQHHASHAQQHVHFAPVTSSFSLSAGDGGLPAASSTSCPASPSVSTRPRAGPGAVATTSPASARGAAGAHATAPSSASSTESGAVHAVSGGSNIIGAPSTASSSRQSSTSISGRTIGAAAAAAVTAAAAGTSAAVATAGNGGRKAVAVSGRPGGAATPRRDGEAMGEAMGAFVGSHDGAKEAAAAAAGSGAPDAQPAPAAQLLESYSTPTAVASRLSSLSPFASMPAAQLGELDAAAPQLAAVGGPSLLGGVAAAGHARPAAPPSPKHAGTPRGAGAGGGRGSGASARPGQAGSTHAAATATAAAAAAAAPGARGRIPGPSFGPGFVAKGGGGGGSGVGTPTGTPRSTGGASHSQPGTPPYRGPAAASPVIRGAGGASGAGSRHGSIAGMAGGGAATPGRSHSGDGPACAGGGGGDAALRPVSVSTHLSEAAARLSRSAVHAHVSGHDEHVAGHHLAGRPGHRRTPSGGTIGSHHHPTAPGRARDHLTPSATAAASYGQDATVAHPRTPVHVGRGGGGGDAASPRISAPNAAPPQAALEPRAAAAGRRGVAGPAPGGAGDIAGSPSAPCSGHLSRLAAVAVAAAARPPASPRLYIPGGPGATSAPSPSQSGAAAGGGGGVAVGVSRIPSVAQAQATVTHGSGQLAPARSSTSRSLDDGSLRRLGLYGEPLGSPLEASGAAGAGANGGGSGAASSSAFAAVDDAGLEDGLGGLRHSPEVTQEAARCFRQSGDLLQLSAAQMTMTANAGLECVNGGGGGDAGAASYAPPASLPRIATSDHNGSPTPPLAATAAVAWQPSRGAGGGASPFAAAAYASPYFPAEADGEGGTEPQAGPGQPGYHLGGEAGSATDTRASSGMGMAATSPTAPADQQMRSAWSAGSVAEAAPPPQAPPPQAPVRAAATATATASPRSAFAQVACEQDSSWWEDQHHDD